MSSSSDLKLSFLGRPVRAALFDLDGTLLDTAGDIALALQRAATDHKLPVVPLEQVRQMIGRGAPILVERADAAMGWGLDAAAREAVVARFFHHYGAMQDSGEAAAVPYPGVVEGLNALHRTGLPMAVVTNKQQRFAEALLARLGLAPLLQAVVGGDTCARRKPDPQPLLHACGLLGVAPEGVVMVGDSVNDMTAARAAGLRSVALPYGYNEGQPASALDCDALVPGVDALPALWGAAAPAVA